MTTRDTAIAGAPCWIDLLTSDVDRSRAFYSELFGWTAAEPSEEFGGYFMFLNGEIPVGGGMGRGADVTPGVPDAWSVYLASDNIDKTVESATAHGGQVHFPPMAVADLGSMTMLADSGGAAIGVWQPGTFQGFSTTGETGYPGWFELHARDYAGALAFYRDVFGWDIQVMSDTPDFQYSVMADGDEQLAGVMDSAATLADGVPSHWLVYFGVDDTDQALAKITQLGGAIVMGATDTPYGRLAVVTDPTGAMFSLLGPTEAMPATASA
jgi:predicted enzyme related to lactoylglutathione lyase